MKTLSNIPFTLKSTDPRRRKIICRRILVGIAFLLAGIYCASLNLPPVKIAQLKFNDNSYRLNHTYNSIFQKDKLRPKDIVFVTVDDISFKRLGINWPWRRDVFARFLDKLGEDNPKVIALDFAFSGRDSKDPEADIKLVDAIKKCGNVILVSAYEDKIYNEPYQPIAEASAGYGVVAVVKDIDRSARQFRASILVRKRGEIIETPFELKTAAYYLDVPYEDIHEEGRAAVLEAGNRRIEIPLNKDGSIYINYLSDFADIETVSAWKIIKGIVPKGTFENKLVLVGSTAEGLGDFHPTPFGQRPGSLIIVNILNTILSSSFLKEVNPAFTTFITVLLYVLCFLVFYKTNDTRPVVWFLTLIFILAVSFISSFLAILNNIILPIFHIVVLLPLLYLGMGSFTYFTDRAELSVAKKAATTDLLTSLYTEKYFSSLLEPAVSNAVRFRGECSLIVVKITNIERIIKDASFDTGKTIQKLIADLIKKKFTKEASGAYLGLGEFGMLLPKIAMNEALGIAGSLRDNIKKTDFGMSEKTLRPVVAIGVSSVNIKDFPKTAPEFMEGAQAAVKRAKRIGPNSICRFNPRIDDSLAKHDITEKETGLPLQADDDYGIIEDAIETKDKEYEDAERHRLKVEKERDRAYIEGIGAVIGYMEQKDPYTAGHSERVGQYSEKIGQKLKLDEDELIPLKEGGILHDLGKIDMPGEILRKKGKLKKYERNRIELHPEISAKILRKSKHFHKILPILRDHQERLDGSGYPRGLKGDQIPLGAQIVAVADVFDALTSKRSYRDPLSYEDALKELLSQPEKLNQKFVLALKETLAEEGNL